VGLSVVALASCGGPSDQGHRSTTTTAAPTTTSRPSATGPTTSSTPSSTAATTTAVPTTTTTAPPASTDFGPYPVVTEEHVWTDTSRPTAPGHGRAATAGRRLPVRIYLPSGGPTPPTDPLPLVVWAHGLDASVDYFDGYLRAWAARGYIVAAPTFPLTHEGAPGGTVFDDVANQPADVRFVIDHLLVELGRPAPGRPRVDPSRIAVGGHSLGGVTALALASGPCCRDPRVRVVFSIDGEAPPFPGGAAPVGLPVLLVHGDADTTFPASASRAVFEAATGHRYLVVLRGAPHTPFRLRRPREVITATVGDFLDLELKGRPGWAAQLERSATVAGFSALER
jgi:dienelactone hydrolase